MKMPLLRAAAMSLLALLPALATAPRAVMAADTTAPPARVIVKYKALGGLMRPLMLTGSPRGPQLAEALSQRLRVPMADGRVVDRQTQVLFSRAGLSSAQLAAQLAADPDVEFAVPDQRRRVYATPADPLFPASSANSPAVGQWYLRTPDSTAVSAINAVAAWDLTTGSPNVVVAVLDTGILANHPDLQGKLVPGYDFINESATANDGNLRDSDPTDPGDWVAADECGRNEPAEDSSWHGTQVSGIIGASTSNGVGMASVGWNVRVLPVRVLGKCGGYDSDIIAGMLWAGGLSSSPVGNANPARVINLSLGSTGSCPASYQDAVNRLTAAGVVVVASAGNEEGLAVGAPANCNGVVAVTGLRHVGTKVGFSNVGPEVTVAAPGGNCVNLSGPCLYPILTTTNAGTTTAAAATYSTSEKPSVGTSFSAPLVAGTVGLMLSANPSLTPAQVRTLLRNTARPFPTTSSDPAVPQCVPPSSTVQDECICTTSTCGAGMLDAGAAVAAAAAATLPRPAIATASDTVTLGSSVAFDGSGSTVPSGRTIASYAWAITAGSGVAAISGSATGSTVQVTTTGAGSFTITLTVTDSAGARANATRTVTVNGPAAPTVRLLASAQAVQAGDTVSFDGSASTAAAGLTVAAYQWTLGNGAGLVTLTSPPTSPTATVQTKGNASGPFIITLTVTDSLGQQSTSSATVTINAVVPTVSFTATALSVSAGTAVGFDGSSSSAAAGRSIASYQWAITGAGAGAAIGGAANGPTVTVNTASAGSFTITLTVTDSAGAQSARSLAVTVTQATGGGGSGGGGGGGGAMSALWLAALALATMALARARRRPE